MSSRRKTSYDCITSAGRVTAKLLLSFLAASLTVAPAAAQLQAGVAAPILAHNQLAIGPDNPFVPPPPASLSRPNDQTFSLRQVYHHGTYRDPRLHVKKNVHAPGSRVFMAAGDDLLDYEIPPLRLKSRTGQMQRLVDRRPSVVDPMVAESRQRGLVSVMSPSAWTIDEVIMPDITDKGTVLSLAIMASDAYVEKEGEGKWEEVGGFYNRTADFGWQADGLRGHVWTDDVNSTIIIGLKGTSPAVFDGEGTTTNDKVNDNLFFSCCCAQQGQWSWHKVCDCATGSYSCNNTCVVQALNQEHRYYTAAKELYSNVTELYPDAMIWLTGHSLGGAVTSLLGLTYGLPTVTFEAVPEALPAYRLGLPVPPGADPQTPQMWPYTGTYHFGHTADPVYMGSCNGATATCSYAGYAMESTCHTGSECVYDVVADKGWRVGIGTHKIYSVIHDVIMKYDDVPECKPNTDCSDCPRWTYYESNGTETTSTTTPSPTSTSMTRTRTATCQTPGWWGCLDKTTTTTGPVTSTTITSTCQTPGWFGCKDKTTTTTTTSEATTTETTTTTTTTCETPGRFWGCYDKTDDLATPTSATPSDTVIPTPPVTATPTPPDSDPTDDEPPTRRCVRRSWLGRCKKWDIAGEDDEVDDEGGDEDMGDM